MKNEDVIATLNSLIKTSRDGEKGFLASAENVSDLQLKMYLSERARSCRTGAHELEEYVRRLGGDPSNSGSVAGAMHRAWLDVKSAVTGKDDKAILNEVERGEDVAKESYEKALKETLPPDVHQVVARQYEGVRENHDHVKQLRGQYART